MALLLNHAIPNSSNILPYSPLTQLGCLYWHYYWISCVLGCFWSC